MELNPEKNHSLFLLTVVKTPYLIVVVPRVINEYFLKENNTLLRNLFYFMSRAFSVLYVPHVVTSQIIVTSSNTKNFTAYVTIMRWSQREKGLVMRDDL